MSRFVQKGQRVVLKPNMSFASGPDRASNTHPAVVRTVAQMCLEAGAAQVMIVDNPLQSADLCLRRAGVADACKGLKNTYVQMFTDRKFYREITIPQGKVLDRVEVIKEVLDSQVLICLPQAKSHSNTGVSMGIKGLMGLIWDRWSFHSKYNINEALADLATVLRPKLTILDATRALTTGGPGGPGEVVKPNLVIAGTDPVAVDSFGVTVAPWYGQRFKGRQVEHLLAASQRGLGRIDLEPLNILRVSCMRTAIQALSLLLFTVLFALANYRLPDWLPADIYLRLDPLLGLSAIVAGRAWVPRAVWGLALLLATVLVGRFFCSYVCPLGAILGFSGSRPLPRREAPAARRRRQAPERQVRCADRLHRGGAGGVVARLSPGSDLPSHAHVYLCPVSAVRGPREPRAGRRPPGCRDNALDEHCHTVLCAARVLHVARHVSGLRGRSSPWGVWCRASGAGTCVRWARC